MQCFSIKSLPNAHASSLDSSAGDWLAANPQFTAADRGQANM